MSPVIYQREVHYYETDRMDCVHHSNYIRWFEEARIYFMQESGFSYQGLEAGGIVSPVRSVQAEYQAMCRFGDTVEILTAIESYTSTRIAFCYQVRDKATGQPRCSGRSCHCFINAGGRPVSLKKAMPQYHLRIEEYLAKGQKEEN